MNGGELEAYQWGLCPGWGGLLGPLRTQLFIPELKNEDEFTQYSAEGAPTRRNSRCECPGVRGSEVCS